MNEVPAPSLRLRNLLVGTFNVTVAMFLATLFALLLFGVALFTLFKARRFYAEVCVRNFSRLLLWLGRTPYRVHGAPAPGPLFYMPNHPSTQDVFVLTALGLPNTRFFMSRQALLKFLPLSLIAALMGVFFTPEQKDTPARVRCFTRAFARLEGSGQSILGTPEGRIVPGPEVGRFNRGVFHLATLLQYPIQPLYLAFPPGRSAGRGYAPSSPEVEVFFLPPIATRGWRVEDLDTNKERVRQVFLAFGQRIAAVGAGPAWAEVVTAAGGEA